MRDSVQLPGSDAGLDEFTQSIVDNCNDGAGVAHLLNLGGRL
jgi:hypothetical protein